MNYQVLLFGATKDIAKLSRSMQKKIAQALEEIARNPRGRNSKKLKASATNAYRWRVGNFRVLYEIDAENRQVHVHAVIDRKDAY